MEKKNDKVNDVKQENKIKKEKKKENKIVSKQTYILSILITISFCLVVILTVNLLVKDDTIFNFDLTYSRLYKLSKQSKEVIKSVNEQVEIAIPKNMNFTQINEILDNIIKLNSNIKVTEYDPIRTEYGYSATIFIKAIDREEITVSFFDITFDTTFMDSSKYKQYSIFEEKLINAIISVTNSESSKNPSVAFLTGIDGPGINEELINLYTELRSFGIVSISLDLEKEDIPESIKIIAIIGLHEDLTREEYNKLINFQARGGDFVIAVTQTENVKAPIFDEFLSTYGVKIPIGALLEYNDNNRYSETLASGTNKNYNNVVYPIVTKDNEITKDMTIEGTKPFFVFPSVITFESQENLDKKNLNIINHVISSTSATFKHTEDLTNYDISANEVPKDIASRIYVMGSIIDKNLSEDKKSTAIIYSSYLFMTDYMLRDFIEEEMILKEDNLRLAKNSFTYLHPLNNEMLNIKKASIVAPYKYNYNTSKNHKVVTYIIYIIPALLIFILGIIVIYKRGYLIRFGFIYKRNIK